MRLSPEQIDQFRDEGWFFLPNCFSEEEVSVLRTEAEEIFKQSRSLIWKSLRVSRIYDAENNALVYLAHARELQLGSGKMSLSVVSLNGADVTWTKGAPRSAATVPAAPAPTPAPATNGGTTGGGM